MNAIKLAAFWIAAGAALGATLGLLYAPQAGIATRRQLRQYSDRARRKAGRLGREVRAGVDRAVRYGRTLVA